MVRGNQDDNGQPTFIFPANLANNVGKAFDQLSGICKGILSDGTVNDAEARFFNQWLEWYSKTECSWALSAVVERVASIFKDGVVSEEERLDLQAIMQEITGDCGEVTSAVPRSSTLPFDEPPPPVLDFTDRLFCPTGRFAFGSRSKVTEAIFSRGGMVQDGSPTRQTNFLLIGTFASRDWIETGYGRKIERAVELRQSGSGIMIIGEDYWRRFVS